MRNTVRIRERTIFRKAIFRKAFDSVWRKGLWGVMRHYGDPEKIARILENAYKDTFSAVRVNGELSEWFETVMGVFYHLCYSTYFWK